GGSMTSTRPEDERRTRLRLAERRRRNMRLMLAEARARARRLRGVPPGDMDDGGEERVSMLRVWLLFMGASLIILTLISIIAIFTEETATAEPPQLGVVQAGLTVESCNDALVLVSNPPAEFFTGEL